MRRINENIEIELLSVPASQPARSLRLTHICFSVLESPQCSVIFDLKVFCRQVHSTRYTSTLHYTHTHTILNLIDNYKFIMNSSKQSSFQMNFILKNLVINFIQLGGTGHWTLHLHNRLIFCLTSYKRGFPTFNIPSDYYITNETLVNNNNTRKLSI